MRLLAKLVGAWSSSPSLATRSVNLCCAEAEERELPRVRPRTVYALRTVENPVSPRDSWGVFAEERDSNVSRRVFGPANVYDRASERSRLVRQMIRGER